MPKHATRTSFQPGRSGNPAGRPPGRPDLMPKIRDLMNAVLQGNEEAVKAALLRAATNHRSVLSALELAARLNREVGPNSEGATLPAFVLLGRDPTIERYRQAAARAPKGSGRKAE
jgi:hypothetical protein